MSVLAGPGLAGLGQAIDGGGFWNLRRSIALGEFGVWVLASENTKLPSSWASVRLLPEIQLSLIGSRQYVSLGTFEFFLGAKLLLIR
jgi:hypothetical protein